MLRGRAECVVLDRLLEDAQTGQSQVLVLRGEAGVGKTALVDHLAERARPGRVTRAAGVESEMSSHFAGLHQLCGPLLEMDDVAVMDFFRTSSRNLLSAGAAGVKHRRELDTGGGR